MEKYLPYTVLFLRLALALTLLAILADKLGYWGEPGTPFILWGNWDNYTDFLQTLVPFLPESITEKFGVAITILEAALALMLLVGLKVRWAAVGTGIYTLVLIILMSIFLSVKAVFNYSLLITCAASFLLACCPIYKWTMNGIKKRSTYHPY